jgi:hypothetical protein
MAIMSSPHQVHSGSALSLPTATGHGTDAGIGRRLAIDASIVLLLVVALVIWRSLAARHSLALLSEEWS